MRSWKLTSPAHRARIQSTCFSTVYAARERRLHGSTKRPPRSRQLIATPDGLDTKGTKSRMAAPGSRRPPRDSSADRSRLRPIVRRQLRIALLRTTDVERLRWTFPRRWVELDMFEPPRVLARAFRICRVCMAEPRRDPARILLVTSRASSGPCQEGGGRQKRQPRRRPCHSMPSSISETSGSASPVPRASYAARIASIAIA
jgi:hypothetical protein